MGKGRDEGNEIHCTDILALEESAENAVDAFAKRWISMPKFTMECEVMDQRQLRDAMGLRATIEAGDPWPAAEQKLLQAGFRGVCGYGDGTLNPAKETDLRWHICASRPADDPD